MKLLELRFYPIEAEPHRFKVSVESELGGEVHHESSLPFVDGEISQISNLQDRRFTVVKILESRSFARNSFDEQEQAWMVREGLLREDKSAFCADYLANIGRKLYWGLGNNIIQAIAASISDAKRDRTWLHIRLWFPADVVKYVRLADYPWELLHNDYGFLSHQGVTFSRYIAYGSPRPNIPPTDKLHVLLISSGAGDSKLELAALPDDEKQAIISGLETAQQQGNIQLEILASPTWKALQTRLLERQNQKIATPHILHFDGHGFFGKRCNETGCKKAYKPNVNKCECGADLGKAQGYLVFAKADGTADFISAKELGELLGHTQLQKQTDSLSGISLVVLSACKSGISLLSESVFNGVGQNLISQGIPAVVAMTYSVTVDAASVFCEYFYRSLGEQEPLTVALKSGQRSMGIEGNQWYRPVLYMRWEDNEGGQLFENLSIQSEMKETKTNDLPQKKSDKPISQITQMQIDTLTKEIKKLEKDFQDVSDKKLYTSNPEEENNLQLQLEHIAKRIEEKQIKINQLGAGNE